MSASLTPWQSLLTTVVPLVVRQLPTIFTSGQSAAHIAPLAPIAVPDQRGIDPGAPLPLCALFSRTAPHTTPTVDVTGIVATGFASLALTPGQGLVFADDLHVAVPVTFGALTLSMRWTTHSQCVSVEPGASGAVVATQHTGTLTVHLTDVAVELALTLCADPLAVTGLVVTIVNDDNWQDQPTIDPAHDVTYDTTMTTAQQRFLNAAIASGAMAAVFRAHATTALDDPSIATAITTVLNQAVDFG